MESLGEYLLELTATKNKLSKPQAAKFINDCLKKISAKANIPFNDLYKILYSFTGLATCLAGSCSQADLQECEKMCHCAIFEERCVPRYIPEAVEINEDPDKYIKEHKLSTSDLEDLLKYASYLYYNYDGGGLTDNSFDALEYNLNKRLKAQGKRYEKIGATPIEKLRKKLPYPMPSLDKLKPGMSALLKFLEQSAETGLAWSEKLDGVSGMVIFKNGKVEHIFTRGDGTIGGDVTYLKDYIHLPKPSYDYLVVRGEFIISKKNWQEKYQGTYANARGFVSAKINQGHLSPALPDIDFLGYQIIDWTENELPSPSQTFKILEAEGFNVPTNGVYDKQTLIFNLISTYIKRRAESTYAIDGLVIALNTPQPIGQAGNPTHTKAFKMTLEEQIRKSKIINVDWNISRYGRYVPVAIFESVYVDGIRLHRASAHNGDHVLNWHLGKGTKITVVRSGDVIPAIKDVTVDKSISPILPSGEYSWHWEKKDIVLDEIDDNKEVQIKRMLYFFQTIQVRGLGEGRIRKFWEAGFTDIKSVTSAQIKDFKKIKGFGPKLSTQIYNNIHDTMKKTRLDRYFVAITTFRTSIGRTTLKQVIRYYPEVLSSSKEEITAHLKKHKIPGIGPKRSGTLADAIPQFRDILYEFNEADIENAIEHQEQQLETLKNDGYNKKIKGKSFVMTGFLGHDDYDLEDYIWDHWGDISSTVTSSTTAVISANLANITGKMLKAQELGVPVYSVDEFVNSFDVTGHQAYELPETVIIDAGSVE